MNAERKFDLPYSSNRRFAKRATLFLITILIVAFLSPAILFSAPTRHQNSSYFSSDDSWLHVSTTNFEIYSSAPKTYVQEIGHRLEHFRQALSLLTKNDAVNSPVPTRIFIFKDDASFKPYIYLMNGKSANVSGYFLAERDNSFLAVSAETNTEQIIYHEYMHSFLSTNLPNIPLWLNEGLSEYYSTFKSAGNEASIGQKNIKHLDYLRQYGLIPLDDFFAVDRHSDTYNETSKQGTFYAQSWLLTHFLLHSNYEVQRQFNKFISKISHSKQHDHIFEDIYNLSIEALRQQLDAYLLKKNFGYKQLTSRQLQIEVKIKTRQISPENTLFQLGNLLAHQGRERFEDARNLFRSSLAINEKFGASFAGLGFIAMLEGKHENARRYLKKAASLSSEDAWVQYQYAQNIASQRNISFSGMNNDQAGGEDSMLKARKAFQRTIKLSPNFMEAYAGLGRTYLFDLESPSTEGIAAMEAAYSRLPARIDIAVDLLTLYAQNENTKKADILLQSITRMGWDKQAIEKTKNRIINVELQRAHHYLQKGLYASSRHHLDRIDNLTKKHAFTDQVKKIREILEYNNNVLLLNKANKFVHQKQFEQAIIIFDNVISNSGNEKIVEEAKIRRRQASYNCQIEHYNQAVALLKTDNYEQAAILLRKIISDPLDQELTNAAKDIMKNIQAYY